MATRTKKVTVPRLVSRSGVEEHLQSTRSGEEHLEKFAAETVKRLVVAAADVAGPNHRITSAHVLEAVDLVFDPVFRRGVMDRVLRE